MNGDAQHHRGRRGQTKAPRRQASVKAESLAPAFVGIEDKEGPLFDVLRNGLVEEGRIKGLLGRLRSRPCRDVGRRIGRGRGRWLLGAVKRMCR